MGTQGEQLEREAQQARARLSGTLEELRGRMTPGQLIDQLSGYARQGAAAEFAGNLGREIRQNPIPLTLIAVGVAWLIIASGRSSRAHDQQSATGKAAEISIATNAGALTRDPERRLSGKP